MDIETKCNIIEEFMRKHVLYEFFEEEDVKDFIEYNNLGIPLAQGVSYNLSNLTTEGQSLVDETWDSLCFILGVRSENDYEDLEDLLDGDEE